MKNDFALTFLVVILVITGGIFFARSNENISSDGGSIKSEQLNAEVQKITLSFKDGNYYPDTIRVKAGQQVQISLDSNVVGCYRIFTIRQLGITKYMKTPQETLTFTPEKKGTYRFACSMGMGTGTLIVE